MACAEQYRRWFDYERDVHAKVLESLETVPADRQSSAEYRKVLDLLGHVISSRQMWLYRLGVNPNPPAGGLTPAGLSLAEITARIRDVQNEWADYLARLNDAELDRVVEYQSLDSSRFRNTLEDILTQLFGHSWYHRGQIATLIRAAGGQPAITDFIFWCREPIP